MYLFATIIEIEYGLTKLMTFLCHTVYGQHPPIGMDDKLQIRAWQPEHIYKYLLFKKM